MYYKRACSLSRKLSGTAVVLFHFLNEVVPITPQERAPVHRRAQKEEVVTDIHQVALEPHARNIWEASILITEMMTQFVAPN